MSSNSDQAVAEEVEEWGRAVRAYGEQVIGQSYVTLNGERTECRYEECNLGW